MSGILDPDIVVVQVISRVVGSVLALGFGLWLLYLFIKACVMIEDIHDHLCHCAPNHETAKREGKL